MPTIVFSSHDNISKIDTSLIVQKPYLRTNYIEAKIEEDIDLENQFRIKKLTNPIIIRETAQKTF